jgi:CBS domain-containing protein
MITVRELLKNKPEGVVTTGPRASVFEALGLLAKHRIGALPVVANGRLVGILSERDYARGVALAGRTSRDTTVAELMTGVVVTVGLDTTIEQCMTLMTDKRARHLPVIEDGELIGIVTIGDVVKQIIDHQAHLIDELSDYIRGQ